LAGLIASGLMVLIWKFRVRPLGRLRNIYGLLPAFAVALAAIIAVRLMTPAPEKNRGSL